MYKISIGIYSRKILYKLKKIHQYDFPPFSVFPVRTYVTNFKQYEPNPNGPNYGLCRHLQRSLNEVIQSADGSEYKIRVLSDAVRVLDRWEQPIRSGDDAMELQGIGEGVARRIDEYLTSSNNAGDLIQMDYFQIKTKNAMRELMKITGIGVTRARRLVEQGCNSIEKLHDPKYFALLPKSTQLSLDFGDVLSDIATRRESELMKEAVETLISSDFDVHIVGSYRRGQETSSNIDILLFHPSFVHVIVPSIKRSDLEAEIPKKAASTSKSIRKTRTEAQMQQEALLESHVIVPLMEQGIIAGTLAFGSRRWQGIAKIPFSSLTGQDSCMETIQKRVSGIKNRIGDFRKLDISIFPEKSKGTALLALTGDKEFNKHIRSLASKQGMLLNENGLWRWRNNNRDISDSTAGFWELVASETEEDVLEQLGMELVEPDKRSYAFLIRRNKEKK